MNDSNYRMPVVLLGNSFKYEVEATLKLFFSTSRFSFSDNLSDAKGESYVIAEMSAFSGDKVKLSAVVCLEGSPEKDEITLPAVSDKNTCEHELCRLIYHILSRKTGIVPPWGLMTGIRPVKKVIELMRQELGRDEIQRIMTEKYEISPDKLELACATAENQLPLLDRIDTSAVSLYVSIPFCPTRCSYCSFVSHSMDSAIKLMPEYVASLCREIEYTGEMVRETGTKIDTIYFGGGTPTSISAEDLRTIMECVQRSFDLNNVREYSVEAGRPDTITEEKLKVIKEYGADRISVNPQTLNDDVLKVIGRRHSGEDAVKAFELARKVGFKNINTDLIAGLPTESLESFCNTLDRIIALSPESITIHTLTIKRSATLFSEGYNVDHEPAADMVRYSVDSLMKNDYLPYYMYRQKNTVDNLENVGYAKKGFESLYNIFIMDETQTILGVGCAASTKLVYPNGKITRIHNHKYPYEYIRRFDELLTKKNEAAECLRILSGSNNF
ncbi:MAG TPA: coproporphyrinogen dehydrogenase HemZ [Ruminococcus sp.]|nr:coproporphyrinogen dehydrogenase HemZ [Ruminococcus sp.]